MSNIKSIRGGVAYIKPEVCHSTVARLEELLAEAQAGMLIGLAYCAEYRNDMGSMGIVGTAGSRVTLGALAELTHEIVRTRREVD